MYISMQYKITVELKCRVKGGKFENLIMQIWSK